MSGVSIYFSVICDCVRVEHCYSDIMQRTKFYLLWHDFGSFTVRTCPVFVFKFSEGTVGTEIRFLITVRLLMSFLTKSTLSAEEKDKDTQTKRRKGGEKR